MSSFLTRLWLRAALRDEDGQGMLEYALIIVFVALVVIAALVVLGPKVGNIFNSASNSLNAT